MDVSQVTNLKPVVTPSATVSKVVQPAEIVPRGNSLPADEQTAVHLLSSQEKNSNSSSDIAQLQGLVDQTNEVLSMQFSSLKFTVAEGTDIPVVRVEDSKTGELIRQIPSEQMVALAKAMEELKQGMLLEEKV